MSFPVPSIKEFFISCYYENTYVPPVDLSDKALASHLLENENPELAKTVQEMISWPPVREVLSAPLSADPEEITKKNKALTERNFTLLSSKPTIKEGKIDGKIPYYSVVEHPNVPGWIIKSGATRVPKDQFLMGPCNPITTEYALFTEEESLMRVAMAARILQVSKDEGLDIVVPKKRLVSYSQLDGIEEPQRKYCVVCEKLDVLSSEETQEAFKRMKPDKQTEFAKKIATLICKAGLVDASSDNIRFTKDGKLAVIDTEPAGLMVAKKKGLWNTLFGQRGASVEKCARIGLFQLYHQTIDAGIFGQPIPKDGIRNFSYEIKNRLEAIQSPKLSKWKIALTVATCGLAVLICLVIAVVKKILCSRVADRAFEKFMQFQSSSFMLNPEKIKAFVREFSPFQREYFNAIEGTPFKTQIA